MRWYVNDLSLIGQYPDSAAFLDALDGLMRLRSRHALLGHGLFCSRTLHARPVTGTMSFREAVQSAPKQVVVPLVLSWLTKHGPFLEDDREHTEDDYFEHKNCDVTDLGLGEAARRRLAGQDASTFSFSRSGFDYSPIAVCQGLPESVLSIVSVPNLWDLDMLLDSVRATVPEPVNWRQMLDQATARFDRLWFSPLAVAKLEREPFSRYVVERVFVLLDILQRFMLSRNPDGTYSATTHELIAQHFSGNAPLFSDESTSNKRDFHDDLSFPVPEQAGKEVFCPWHGKMNYRKYRIHFEWPVEKERQTLRVFYIGPKITKG